MEQTFGQRLKNYRKAKNLTQQELAEMIGVSDKTVSRWESDGGYPDVPTLAPLARALGVTVDDLLNTQRPIRTLTRTDWQNLLSFAFALGGGVLFFLFKLFVPALLCYLGYLACLAYGVYLQKYYAYQSRWFLLGEAVVNLSVNLAILWEGMALLAGVTVTLNIYNQHQWWRRLLAWGLNYFALVGLLGLVLALAVTAATQYLVWKKGFDGQIPLGTVSRGHAVPGHAPAQVRLGWSCPHWRKLTTAFVPLLAGCFWLPAVWEKALEQGPEPFEKQEDWFLLWLLVLGILAALPLLKKGFRRWLIPAWAMTAVCSGMLGLRVYPNLWSEGSRRVLPNTVGLTYGSSGYIFLGWGSWGTLVFALCLSAAWLALCGICLKKTEHPYGA